MQNSIHLASQSLPWQCGAGMDGDLKAPDAEKPGLRILRNGGWLLGGKTVAAVLSIVYLALITRSLGPAGFGSFALIFSFAQVVTGLVSFQTWQIIIRYGTKYVLDEAHDRLAQLVWLCLAMDIAGFIVGILLAIGGAYLLAGHFGWDPDFRWQVILFSATILLAARATVIGILRVHDRYRDAALADTLVSVIRFFGVLLVIFIRPNIEGFLLVWALSEIITTLIMWIIIARSVKLPLGKQSLWHIPRYYRQYSDLTRFAAFSNLGASLRLASQQLIVLVVGFYTGPAAAGFFRLGHQLGQVLARIADGLSFAIFTEFNRMEHRSGSAAARSMIARTMKVTAVSAGILMLILLLAGKPMITGIFGADFAPAYPLVLLLGGAAAVQVAAMALEPALLSRGHAGWALMGNLFGVIVLVIMLFVLMPTYGATGAAVAVLIGSIAAALGLGLAYRRTTAMQKN